MQNKKQKQTVKSLLPVGMPAGMMLTAKAADPPVITRYPAAQSVYAENATARFVVNANSIDGGYLTYQWYRSGPFGSVQTDAAAKAHGTAQALTNDANTTLITVTPPVTGTQYYYYWVEVTNHAPDGTTVVLETDAVQAEIKDKMLPDRLKNGDFERWFYPNGKTNGTSGTNQDNTFYAQQTNYNGSSGGWIFTGGEYVRHEVM